MLYYSANVLLLECLMRQARDDTAAMPGRTDGIETKAAAMRVRADAAEFLTSVQSAYHEIQDAAGAVMEVIARRRLAWPIVNEAEDEEAAPAATCSRCGERKELIEFYMTQKKGYKQCRDSWCSECRREYKRLRVGQTRSVEAKCCPDCHQTLAASEFHSDRSRYDGLYTYCHHCKAVRARAAKRGRLMPRYAISKGVGERGW